MYVTYTRIYGWSDYGGESSYQPGYRLENMMWMTLLVYDYIIPERKENFGIACLTNEKQYYTENYPEIVVESGSLDQVILMLTGGGM